MFSKQKEIQEDKGGEPLGSETLPRRYAVGNWGEIEGQQRVEGRWRRRMDVSLSGQ